MPTRKIIALIAILMFIPFMAGAQLLGRHKAKVTENDSLRNGRYYEYWDFDTTKISAKGHFLNGLPVKTWKYYYKDGTRRMKVKYRENLRIKYYSPAGKLEQKGYAILAFEPEQIHFYWDGIWKYYNPKRKLYRIALYKNGEEISVIYGPEDPVYFGE